MARRRRQCAVIFHDLLLAIDQAAVEQAKPASDARDKLDQAKSSAANYKEALEAALAREVSLLRELYALKKQLAELTGGAVLPIRGKRIAEKWTID